MTGERRIPAPRRKVWNALNDPQVLKSCIPGCESLEKTSDTDLKATVAVKVGPMAGRFTGKVQLTDLDPPNSYRIGGEGQGGVLGHARGGADVRLADDGPFTLLTYEVKAQVGGKLAQLGARLIDATSKQMAEQFFDRFTAEVASPRELGADGVLAGAVASASAPAAPGAVRVPSALGVVQLLGPKPFGFPYVFWIGSVLYLAIFILIFSAYL